MHTSIESSLVCGRIYRSKLSISARLLHLYTRNKIPTQWQNADRLTDSLRSSKGARRILVRGSMPPCRLRRRTFWKFEEGYSRRMVMINNNNNNNHHQLDQPVITRITSPPPLFRKLLFCMFSLFNFSSLFPGGTADPICPYVRTPCVLGLRSTRHRFSWSRSSVNIIKMLILLRYRLNLVV